MAADRNHRKGGGVKHTEGEEIQSRDGDEDERFLIIFFTIGGKHRQLSTVLDLKLNSYVQAILMEASSEALRVISGTRSYTADCY